MSLVVAQGCPICALQQVVGYLGYSGHDTGIVAEAARDPFRKLGLAWRCCLFIQ